jgi:hypothetical protein
VRTTRPGNPDPTTPASLTSRRSFLRGVVGLAGVSLTGAAAASALAGCEVLPTGGEPAGEPHELEGLLGATVALGDQYETAIAAVPALSAGLQPVLDAHRAHAAALAEAIGVSVPPASPSPSPVPPVRAGAVAALVAAERAGRDAAVAACLEATPRLAALLGSIAAARASHLEVLK